jgi:hypothetical protein
MGQIKTTIHMKTQKYAVNQHLIQILLSWVRSVEIAIPELQRPFGWDGSKVCDGMGSLYNGFHVGYLYGATRMCGSRTVRPKGVNCRRARRY